MKFFLTFFSHLLAIIVGAIIRPFIEAPAKKIKKYLRNKPIIVTRKHKDKRILEKIKEPLRFINQWPRFSAKFQDIRDKLNEIEVLAKQIKTKDYQEKKMELINFSKENHFKKIPPINEKYDLFAPDHDLSNKAYKLIQQIDELLSSSK